MLYVDDAEVLNSKKKQENSIMFFIFLINFHPDSKTKNLGH
jgi:hypothetical protein